MIPSSEAFQRRAQIMMGRQAVDQGQQRDFPHLVELALPPKGFRSVSLERKSVREHERLGYAVAVPGEQFERPSAGGARAALAVWHRGRNSLLTVLCYRG
jgi:hypothetical protein